MSLEPRLIAKRRVIKRIALHRKTGVIVANGTLFNLHYGNLLDLVQAVEMLMLKLTGKLLLPKFRARVTNRGTLKIDRLEAGDYSLYDGSAGPAACEPEQMCSVTEDVLTTHYLKVEIAGVTWHNWFCRLDELIKILYVIVREAQEQAASVPHETLSARPPVKQINLSPGVIGHG